MERVLIADDSFINRELLTAYLDDEYEVADAENGAEVLQELKKHPETAILLLDLNMPVMDGFQVLEELKEQGVLAKMPVIVISGENNVEIESRVFDMGVCDFVHKPFEVKIVQQRVRNAVELYSTRNRLAEKVEEQTQELIIQNRLLEEKTSKLEEINRTVIDALGTTVEFRHMDSYQHISRVKAFTRTLANQVARDFPEYGLDEKGVDLIVDASSLHDVGKISIPDGILLKPGRLDKDEFSEMKKHTVYGGQILTRLYNVWDDTFRKTVYDICMYHHERYDGKGYPEGLVGETIPLSAQIVSVVDVYDALVCKRVYKPAIPKDEAARMILDGECGNFNPKILQSFKECLGDIEHLADTIIDTD